ncbi:hypothetical protein HDZ31DRAFT_68378 [Schizophyllum fasciatum]
MAYRCLAPFYTSSSPGRNAGVKVIIVYDGPHAGIYTDRARVPAGCYGYSCSSPAHAYHMWYTHCIHNHNHAQPPSQNEIDFTIHAWCVWRQFINSHKDSGYVEVDESALNVVLERLQGGQEMITQALKREQQPLTPIVQKGRDVPASAGSTRILGSSYRIGVRTPSPDIWQDIPLAPPPPPPASNRPIQPTSNRSAPPSSKTSDRTGRSPVKASQGRQSARAISLSSSDDDNAGRASARVSAPPSPSKPRVFPAPGPVRATASAKGRGIAVTTTITAGAEAPRSRSSSPRKPRSTRPQLSKLLSSTSTSSISALTEALEQSGVSQAAPPVKTLARWWVVICETDGTKRTTTSLTTAERWLSEAEAAGLEAYLQLAEGEEQLACPKQEGRGNPGIWHGDRKDFLETYLERYLERGRHAGQSYVSQVIDAYLKEYPYHFDDDPGIPEDITEKVVRDELDAKAKQKARAKADPVRSWFKNQRTKQNSVTKHPFRAFLAQNLKVLSAIKPRHEAEHKMWMKQPEYREILTPIFKERWARQGLPSTQELAYRVRVAQEVYEEQNADVKERVRQLVKEDYARRVALRTTIGESDDVTPESADLCCENITALVEPLLKELCRLCNLNVGTIILARPPRDEHDAFKIISVDVGRTVLSEGDVKLPDFDPESYCDVFLKHLMRIQPII